MKATVESDTLLALCGLGPKLLQLPKELNVEEFWKLVRRNAVEVQVVTQLHSLNLLDQIPGDIREEVRSTLEWSRKRSDQFSLVLDRVKAAELPIILLKGAAFGATLYHDLHYKRMNDVDLLIKREHLHSFLALIKELGFRTVAESSDTIGDHHVLPYFHPESKTVLGIHWNLTSQKKHRIPVEWLWESTATCWYNGRPSLVMNSEMNLLHLCIHLPLLKTGVRELADVCHLVDGKQIDWKRFFHMARQVGAEEQVYRVLTLANALFPSDRSAIVPSDFIDKSSRFVRRETEGRAEALLESRSTVVTTIERWFLLYKLTPNRSERSLAFRQIWANLLSRKRLLFGGFSSLPPLPLLRVLSIEHGGRKVIKGLLGLTLHHALQCVLPRGEERPGLLEDDTYQLFWSLE